MDNKPGTLWGITTYFNPVAYRRKLDNYRRFRQDLAVPLVTVELAYDGRFELTDQDADILIRIRGRDVLWQKEKLLQLALEHVPVQCINIAWLDCDVLFERSDWPRLAGTMLDTYPVVQLFSHFKETSAPDVSSGKDLLKNTYQESLLKRLTRIHHRVDVRCQLEPLPGARFGGGYAWAARRELLDTHGFYDACILGGGDRAWAGAVLGQYDTAISALQMSRHQASHYKRWAVPLFHDVGGRVGLVTGKLLHLWHGRLEDRAYRTRHHELGRFDFDPQRDISLDVDSCWRWSSDKTAMHDYVRRYFEARREDG